MGIVIFNGISSDEVHIQVEHPPGYATPAREYQTVHVPGRNGDLVIDQGSYTNGTRSYDISFGSSSKKFADMAPGVSQWLHSAKGYARLEDSYEPEYYRMAVYKEECSIENILNHGGRVTINFDCKPQRFLKHGETPICITGTTSLQNPTMFPALPIITVRGTGSGQFRVGDVTCVLSNLDGFVVVNSELQDVYKETANKNQDSVFTNGFPVLNKGLTEISFSGDITELEVIPQWWIL